MIMEYGTCILKWKISSAEMIIRVEANCTHIYSGILSPLHIIPEEKPEKKGFSGYHKGELLQYHSSVPFMEELVAAS